MEREDNFHANTSGRLASVQTAVSLKGGNLETGAVAAHNNLVVRMFAACLRTADRLKNGKRLR